MRNAQKIVMEGKTKTQPGWEIEKHCRQKTKTKKSESQNVILFKSCRAPGSQPVKQDMVFPGKPPSKK